MRPFVALVIALSAGLPACRTTGSGSVVKDDAPAAVPSLDDVLGRLDNDLNLLGVAENPPAALALAGTGGAANLAAQIDDLITKLNLLLDTSGTANTAQLRSLVVNLKALSQLASGSITPDQRARVTEVLARADLIVHPPIIPPRSNADVTGCVDAGSGRYFPTNAAGQTIAGNGAHGLNDLYDVPLTGFSNADCTSIVNRSRMGLTCSQAEYSTWFGLYRSADGKLLNSYQVLDDCLGDIAQAGQDVLCEQADFGGYACSADALQLSTNIILKDFRIDCSGSDPVPMNTNSAMVNCRAYLNSDQALTDAQAAYHRSPRSRIDRRRHGASLAAFAVGSLAVVQPPPSASTSSTLVVSC